MDNLKNLESKVSDMTLGELKNFISEIVKEAVEEALENNEALKSPSYINSIKEARQDYNEGNYTKLEDIT